MIKKLFIFLIVNFLIVGAALAQSETNNQSTDAIVKNIMTSQKVSEISQINCDQVSDEQFDSLGDAYMELIHPGKQHEYMDQMMGGEGSTSLKLMHIQMGRAYLGCGAAGLGGGMMGTGMMGAGMMTGGMRGGYYPQSGANFNSLINKERGDAYNMMGFPGMGFGFIWWWLVVILGVILIGGGLIWILRTLTSSPTSQAKTLNALEILKSRYAKGEISREEFIRMKNDIT